MAIAFDNAAAGSGGGTTITSASFSISGTDTLALVGIANTSDNTDVLTGVTFNGVPMTRAHVSFYGNGGANGWLYYLFGATTGVVQITNSSTKNYAYAIASWNGVSNVGIGATKYVDSGTTSTQSLTTTVDNSWTILFSANADGNNAASTGSTMRGAASALNFFDSASPITPSGTSYSMSITYPGGRTIIWDEIEISPSNSNILSMGTFIPKPQIFIR